MEAVRLAERAVALAGRQDPRLLDTLAAPMLRQLSSNGALQVVDEALHLDPSPDIAVWFAGASGLMASGQPVPGRGRRSLGCSSLHERFEGRSRSSSKGAGVFSRRSSSTSAEDGRAIIEWDGTLERPPKRTPSTVFDKICAVRTRRGCRP